MDDVLRITKAGTTINLTTAVFTPTLLPTNEASESPRLVRISIDTGVAYVKVGVAQPGTNSAVLTPTLNDLLVTPNEGILLNTRGMQYIGAITRTGTCNLNVVPVEL